MASNDPSMHLCCCSCPFGYDGLKCQNKIPNNCTNQSPALQPCSGKCVSKESICSGNKTCSYSNEQIDFNCGGKWLPRDCLKPELLLHFFCMVWAWIAWITMRHGNWWILFMSCTMIGVIPNKRTSVFSVFFWFQLKISSVGKWRSKKCWY